MQNGIFHQNCGSTDGSKDDLKEHERESAYGARLSGWYARPKAERSLREHKIEHRHSGSASEVSTFSEDRNVSAKGVLNLFTFVLATKQGTSSPEAWTGSATTMLSP